MKYITLKNMERATKMIANKGYAWDKANDIAIECFKTAKHTKQSVEFIIGKIRDADK